MRPEVDDPEVLPPGEHTQEDVIAAILILFPDAEVTSDDDGQLVINTNCMWSGKHGRNVLGKMNIGATTDKCFRCLQPIESRVEVVWLDSELRNDCPESEDGAPHEPASADVLGIAIEEVDGGRVVIIADGVKWDGAISSSGPGDGTFADEREAVAAYMEAEFGE